MNSWKKALLLWCVVVGVILGGADNFSRQERRRGMGQRGNIGNMMFGRLIAEEKIAAAFPEKYAALEAAREKYEAELAALAKEADVKLPAERDDAMRQIRKKFPAEFSALIKEMESSPREAWSKLRELAQKAGVQLFVSRSGRGRDRGSDTSSFSRSFNRPDLGKLRRKYPEEMREYDKLRGKDPEAARRKLLEIIKLDRK